MSRFPICVVIASLTSALWAANSIVQKDAPPPPPAKLIAYENANRRGPIAEFWREAGADRGYAGSYKDLDDREVEFNDKIKSVALFGPSETSVTLYKSKDFKDDDDVIRLQIPKGATELIINDLDKSDTTPGVTWVKDPGADHKGIAGQVSGLKW